MHIHKVEWRGHNGSRNSISGIWINGRRCTRVCDCGCDFVVKSNVVALRSAPMSDLWTYSISIMLLFFFIVLWFSDSRKKRVKVNVLLTVVKALSMQSEKFCIERTAPISSQQQICLLLNSHYILPYPNECDRELLTMAPNSTLNSSPYSISNHMIL